MTMMISNSSTYNSTQSTTITQRQHNANINYKSTHNSTSTQLTYASYRTTIVCFAYYYSHTACIPSVVLLQAVYRPLLYYCYCIAVCLYYIGLYSVQEGLSPYKYPIYFLYSTYLLYAYTRAYIGPCLSWVPLTVYALFLLIAHSHSYRGLIH